MGELSAHGLAQDRTAHPRAATAISPRTNASTSAGDRWSSSMFQMSAYPRPGRQEPLAVRTEVDAVSISREFGKGRLARAFINRPQGRSRRRTPDSNPPVLVYAGHQGAVRTSWQSTRTRRRWFRGWSYDPPVATFQIRGLFSPPAPDVIAWRPSDQYAANTPPRVGSSRTTRPVMLYQIWSEHCQQPATPPHRG